MQYQYIGFWRRVAATLLDWLILTAVSLLLGVFLKGTTGSIILNIASIAISIGYVVGYQSYTGQTLGKKVMGIRVVDAQGNKPSAMTFFLRDVIGKMVSGLILGIGYLMVIWDSKKQALHDKIASTYVIKA